MKKLRANCTKLLFIIAICICVSFLVATAWPLKTHPQSNSPVINNSTQAFQVIGVVNDADSVKVTFKNGYSKAITAFVLSGDSRTSGVQVDFTSGDTVIAPGETYEYDGPTNIFLSSPMSTQRQLNVRVLSVIFDDGSSDGDNKSATSIKNRRLGMKIQLARILPLIQHAAELPDTDMRAVISQLKAQISTLPDRPQNGEPVDITSGLLHGKNYILGDIQRLEQIQDGIGGVNFRSELLKIKERYQKEAARL